tara:strand:- start:68 stop:244 length:177 start_codon:yes stop_codon:yes gene_type:complete
MRTITIRAFRPSTGSSMTLTCDLPCYVGNDSIELLAREYLSALLPSWGLAMFVVEETI